MKNNVLAVGLVLFFSSSVFAQQALVGKYSGTYIQTTNQGDVSQGLTLEIASLEGEKVTGKVVRTARGRRASCNGEYSVAGTVKDNALVLRSTEKGGPAEDCGMTLRLTVERDKLVGTMNSYKAELSK